MISLKTLLALAVVGACTGCSTVSGAFTNEVTCGAEGKLLFTSFYGPVGISSKVDKSPVACADQGVKK